MRSVVVDHGLDDRGKMLGFWRKGEPPAIATPSGCSLMATQGMSLRAIARELDRRGVPTARGGVWQAVTVLAVLARNRPA